MRKKKSEAQQVEPTAPALTPEESHAVKLKNARDLAAHFEKMTLDNLRGAIDTMRRFLDDAERAVERSEADWYELSDKVGDVIHSFGWGQANASSSIQSALKNSQKCMKAKQVVQDLERGGREGA